MKKRCHIIITIIILASFFISCGIPNYFYLDDNDYTFTSENDDDKTEINATLEISDDEQLEQLDNGISMVYFYYLSTEASNTTSFISKFETEFRGSSGIGIIGGPSDLADDAVISYSSDDESYDLYALNFKEEQLVSPDYHDLIELQIDKTIYADFNFNMKEDSESYIVNYQRDTDEDEEFDTEDFQLDLYRFNRDNFLKSTSSLDDSDSDYSQFSGNQPGTYYIHIFASFTAQEGNFKNRWWSSLEYLGALKIN